VTAGLALSGVQGRVPAQKMQSNRDRTMKRKERLVVVGGSAAGPSAAAKARRVNPDLEIMVFEQLRYVSYGA